MRELTRVRLMAGIIFTREETLPNCEVQLHQLVSSLPAAVLGLDAPLRPVGSSHRAVLICVNCPVNAASEFIPAGQVHR